VNSALDVASRDPELGKAVTSYLDEIRGFFRRNLEAGRRAGGFAATFDIEVMAGHLLGIVVAIRVLARTGAKRRVLENVAQPALDLLHQRPAGRKRKSR
jgi:TetR/AcrR family transcriptional repressor of nem operon